MPGRYILHRVGPLAKSNGRKAMFGYPSWHMLLCGDDAHTIGIRIEVGKVCKLCRVKIYSNSRVRGHGRLEWLLLSLMSFVLQNCLTKERKELVLKYRKGTGKDVSTIWRWSGRTNKSGYPILVFYVVEIF